MLFISMQGEIDIFFRIFINDSLKCTSAHDPGKSIGDFDFFL